MKPSIYTLIPDIYALVRKKDGWFHDEMARDLSTEIARRLQRHFNDPGREPRLRLSQMGPRCPRALWNSIHCPESAQGLPAWAEIKYSFGHTLEALGLTLAKAAGHSVTGEQDEITLDDIIGHRDAVIDGCVVDVKSCSSRAFEKFKSGLLAKDDGFGYLDQIDGYVCGSVDDPLVTAKDRGYLLAIEKTLGHMYLYEHRVREEHIRRRIKTYKQIVERSEPPNCECELKNFGESGNVGLGFRASYETYKFGCFPNLRTFLYAGGPVYLTKVVRKPDVPEVDRYGKTVYN